MKINEINPTPKCEAGNVVTLSGVINLCVKRFSEEGRARTAETYQAALRSFTAFAGGDIEINAVTASLLLDYEQWLAARGVSPNCSSFYMRILRAAYNRAVALLGVNDARPFARVYTGVAPTAKRAVDLSAIKAIKRVDLALLPHLDYSRDMFMLSFYMRGMSWVDMAYLRRNDLSDGLVTYRRRKTGRPLRVKWEPCMQAIVDKYPPNRCGYLLPIITAADEDPRRQYLRRSLYVNRNLKALAARLGLRCRLTMYVARHSWATIAHNQELPIAVISEAMGHSSEAVTRIYLAGIDGGVIDRANSMILELL